MCPKDAPCLRSNIILIQSIIIDIFFTRVSEMIMFSPCVFVCLCVCLCLSRCLSGRFSYEGLVSHKQYFAAMQLGMSSCASYVSCIRNVIDDVSRTQSGSNFEIDKSPSIFLAIGSIKSSNYRKCLWLSGWYIQLRVLLPVKKVCRYLKMAIIFKITKYLTQLYFDLTFDKIDLNYAKKYCSWL